jgi:primosomal protein N''
MDLGLGLLGASIAFASGLLPVYARGLSLAAAVVLMSALVFRTRLGFSAPAARRWFDARSLAESVRSAAWAYSMRVGPFKQDATADDEFHKYITRLRRTLGKQVTGHLPEVTTREQITDAMKTLRSLDPVPRRDRYLQERLADQLKYYSRRATDHEVSSRFWFALALCAELFAVVAAGLKALGAVSWNPIPLLIAIGGAATAMHQLGKHAELANSYRNTRAQLEDFEPRLRRVETDDSLEKTVLDIESVISQEHKAWILPTLLSK